MYRVTLRFYEELNDFLPPPQRKRDTEHCFPLPRSVKDLIESLGVPHVEVDLILVNGRSVPFEYPVRDGDRISVYPVFERLEIGSISRLRPVPLRTSRFVADVHLHTLARRLRMLGFDTRYPDHHDDAELAEISRSEERILLTRGRQLLMRSIVTRGLFVRSTDPDVQIREVVDRLDLYERVNPFSRCIACNDLIEPLIEPLNSEQVEALRADVPPGVRSWCRRFQRCRGCGKVYWRGSHYERMSRRIEELIASREAPPDHG